MEVRNVKNSSWESELEESMSVVIARASHVLHSSWVKRGLKTGLMEEEAEEEAIWAWTKERRVEGMMDMMDRSCNTANCGRAFIF